jgi:hypothetical protein
MRLSYLLSVSLFGLVACAAEPVTEGELPIDGDASSVGKGDVTGVIAFSHVEDAFIGSSRLQKGGTYIITSKSAWKRVMGSDAPKSIDFSREWVAFFGMGSQSSGGYSAQITDLRAIAGGGLVLSTHAVSPGNDCLVTLAFTTPHDVIKFNIPSPRPTFAFADASDEVKKCGPSNADRLVELAESQKTWDAAKADHANSYTYTRDFHSFIGFSGRTTLVVKNGVVVERTYKAQHVSGGEPTIWTETGAEVGTHDEGAEPVLVDALYEECRGRVLTQDEDKNWMSFSLDDQGLLQHCTFTPMGCQDDCARGPTISSITF